MIEALILLVVVGVVIWLVQTYIPMPQPIRILITVLVVLGACIYLLEFFGLTHWGLYHHPYGDGCYPPRRIR